MAENKCVFSILDYGAVPDGRTKNTQAFSKAIQACRSAGGGTVLVPAGQYLTGPINLTSNMTLHIQAGARLLFSQDFEDYPPTAFISGATKWHGAHPCIFAKGG